MKHDSCCRPDEANVKQREKALKKFQPQGCNFFKAFSVLLCPSPSFSRSVGRLACCTAEEERRACKSWSRHLSVLTRPARGGKHLSLLIFQRVRNWQKTVGWFRFLLRGTAARRFSFQERKRNEETGGRKGTSPPHAVAWSPGGQMYWLQSDVLTFGGMYAESMFALRDALREKRHTGHRGNVDCLLIYFASFFLWSIPNISP